MIEIANRKPVRIFRVLDRDGEPIGQIIRPKASPVIGVGARTVLLVRAQGGGEKLLQG
jgi:hypothetical protein